MKTNLSEKWQRPYLIFVNFETPSHYLGLPLKIAYICDKIAKIPRHSNVDLLTNLYWLECLKHTIKHWWSLVIFCGSLWLLIHTPWLTIIHSHDCNVQCGKSDYPLLPMPWRDSDSACFSSCKWRNLLLAKQTKDQSCSNLLLGLLKLPLQNSCLSQCWKCL